MSSLRARSTIADERQAYQALLAAESAINSFQQRINALPPSKHYSEALNIQSLNTWLASTTDSAGKTLNSHSLGSVATSTLTVVAIDPASNSFTLEAHSNLAANRGSKKVLVDMSLDTLGLSPRVHAALTSFVPITINGNAAVGGQDGSALTGIQANVALTTSSYKIKANSSREFDLKLDDTSLIKLNQYLDIGAYRYKVTAKSGNTLSLRPMTSVSTDRQINSGVSVGLVSNALASAVPGTSLYNFQLSEASGFLVKDTIYVGTYVATITGMDYATGMVTVTWTGAVPSSSNPIPEGTPIRRNILGAASAGTISAGNDNKIRVYNGSSALDAQRVPNPAYADNPLFHQTFGATEAQVLASARTITLPTNPISGLTYLNGNWDSSTIPLCGQGMLIVSGYMNLNNTCPEGFSGLLYVKGDFDMQGDAALRGAVVVEGSSGTRIRGTATDMKITYDPIAIFKAGQLYAPLGLSLKKQTWRQQ